MNMNTNTQEDKEKLIGFEIMRLMTLSRDESVNDLLSAALAGRPATVESVSKLFHFVLRNFGTDVGGNTPSTVTRKYWDACSAFLKDAGLTKQQLDQIHSPFPRAGEPGFRSILDEMHDEGL
jgi:O-acetyl-ADP-ribose deacetylase (regulator of RNase III)